MHSLLLTVVLSLTYCTRSNHCGGARRPSEELEDGGLPV